MLLAEVELVLKVIPLCREFLYLGLHALHIEDDVMFLILFEIDTVLQAEHLLHQAQVLCLLIKVLEVGKLAPSFLVCSEEIVQCTTVAVCYTYPVGEVIFTNLVHLILHVSLEWWSLLGDPIACDPELINVDTVLI